MAGSHDADNGRLTDQDRQRLAAATVFHRQRLGIAPQVSRRGLLARVAAAIAVAFGGKGAR